MSQVTRRGGNGDRGVHLQPGQRKSKGEESVAQLILISHRALLILHARHKFTKKKKKNLSISALCQPKPHNHTQLQGSLFDMTWQRTGLRPWSSLTEADTSHFKVITSLLLLIFGRSDGNLLVGDYWQPRAALHCCRSLPAKSAKKHCLSAQSEDTDLWWRDGLVHRSRGQTWKRLHKYSFILIWMVSSASVTWMDFIIVLKGYILQIND